MRLHESEARPPKRVLTFYNERSIAAHTSRDIEMAPLVETYVLMRNALVRMIADEKVPTASDLDALLFCVEPSGADASR